MEVPDHDVVTRRKQFRSKKDKADKKKAKKDQKKAEKDKTKQKGDGKQTKKGRTAKEKLEDQKKTTEKTKKNLRAKDRAGENASPSSSKIPPASLDVPAPAASKVSSSKSSPVSRKMKRLRRMSTAKACMGVKVGTDAEAIEGAECQEVEMQPPSNAEKKKKKQEKKTDAGNTTKKKTKGQSSTQKASKASKGGKKNGSPEKKKKVSGETKSAKRSRKVKEGIAVDQKVKDLILKTLTECQSSHCTHPSYVAVEVDGLDNSIYWSRKAVGVKIDRNLLSNPKAKGKGKAQIAYFGGKTPCTYSNMVLAGLFVTRLGLVNHISISNHLIFWPSVAIFFCIGPCIT